jgi:acetyl/propionyl-CoA carboxylase alpha subunit
VNYVGAGTIEFIADASEGLRGDRIWFMEMNTRLQVEHPVTEEITGQDLVEWQLRVASGEKLPLKQEELSIEGHAIEARLYAENVEAGFLPSIGRLDILELGHERVESAIGEGDEISPFYDPMIAKIVVHRDTRAQAVSALCNSASEIEAYPVKTNAGFLVRCLSDEAFRSGEVDTGLIERRGAALTATPPPSESGKSGAARALIRGAQRLGQPGIIIEGFRLNASPVKRVRMRWRDELITAEPLPSANDVKGFDRLRVPGVALVPERGEMYEFTLDTGERSADEASAGDGAILSPMPGKIVSVAAKAGAKLKKGDPILVLEAMKMEHTLTAPFDGKLTELNAKPGAQVSEGVLLAKLESE